MGLEAYTSATEFVAFSAKEDSAGITVRGLTLDDVTTLVATHLGAIAVTVDAYQEAKAAGFQDASGDRFVIAAIRAAPALVAEVIAIACDQPELVDKAAALGFGVQVTAVQAIIKCTLEDSGGIKNLSAALTTALSGLAPQIRAAVAAARKTRSFAGIGAVGETPVS